MISVIVPIHDMANGPFFLWRCINSILSQTYKNYEIIITKEGLMAKNTNAGIKKAKGDIIKILYMDDYLAHPDSLQRIFENWEGGWLVTGCEHDDGKTRGNPHLPTWNTDIYKGNNTIGSPSVLAFEKELWSGETMYFDENLSWTLDCDLYQRLYKRYGPPTILNDINVVIGLGEHQTTHQLSDQQKQQEVIYTTQKHE